MTSARNCERIPVISGIFFNGVVHATELQGAGATNVYVGFGER